MLRSQRVVQVEYRPPKLTTNTKRPSWLLFLFVWCFATSTAFGSDGQLLESPLKMTACEVQGSSTIWSIELYTHYLDDPYVKPGWDASGLPLDMTILKDWEARTSYFLDMAKLKSHLSLDSTVDVDNGAAIRAIIETASQPDEVADLQGSDLTVQIVYLEPDAFLSPGDPQESNRPVCSTDPPDGQAPSLRIESILGVLDLRGRRLRQLPSLPGAQSLARNAESSLFEERPQETSDELQPLFGFGYRFSPSLSARLLYRPLNLPVDRFTALDGEAISAELHYRWRPDRSWRPTVAAGLGHYRFDRLGSDLGLTLQAGLEVGLSSCAALELSYRRDEVDFDLGDLEFDSVQALVTLRIPRRSRPKPGRALPPRTDSRKKPDCCGKGQIE